MGRSIKNIPSLNHQLKIVELKILKPIHNPAEKLTKESFDVVFGDSDTRNLGYHVGINL